MKVIDSGSRPAGYVYLLEKLDLAGVPNWHQSSVSATDTHQVTGKDGFIDEIFRPQYWPGDTIGDHLEFALKYDGINLGLLAHIFEHVAQDEIIVYLQTKPTSKYARRIWFFYEFLTGQQLPLKDLASGNYIDVLDADKYYAIHNGKRSPRHRVVNNLPGTRDFCPIIRRTAKLNDLDTSNLRQRCEEITSVYPSELLHRALNYLYNKETRSSFEIEHLKPNASRTERFIAALELAEKEDFCEKTQLIALQNLIVDPRFKDSDYRTSQNYVGQTAAFQQEIIHYISPKPADLPGLMSGLIDSHNRMKTGNISPLVHAAAITYGFVFLHPFEDGNGRIHRFLIHNILALRGMVPRGLMFPVSAVMLKNPTEYDASLEAFSKPLLPLIDYRLDESGCITVANDTARWYRYMDMTPQTEALYGFVVKTIEEELAHELRFLANYDQTRRAIQEIIDMPDRLIDRFIQLSLQNNGRLSARKRAAQYNFLTDEELTAMEQAVRDGYGQAEN